MDLGGVLFVFHSKLGWILGGRVEQLGDKIEESSLLVSTVDQSQMASSLLFIC